MAPPNIHTAETGQPGNLRQSTWWTGGPTAGWESSSAEPNLDLHFPYSSVVFDQMVRTDAQVGGLFRAITLSIRRAKWDLAAEGVRPEVVDLIRTEIGLPKPGDTLPKRPFSTVVFDDHLRTALSCLQFGHSVFERVYTVEPGEQSVVHLGKLAARPQRTLMHFLTDTDGDLQGVVQTALPSYAQKNAGGIQISKDVLVVYCHEREGADWAGVSILRSAYKHWLVKDVLLRISAQIVERNGMGVPVVYYDGTDVTKEDALQQASDFRSGATAGMALPVQGGSKMELVGVTGSIVDPLPLMKYQDEAIAQSALAMFMTLGHDAGARALGDTFLVVFNNSLQAVADFMAAEFTEQVIRPLVELNFGVDETYPTLTPGDLTAKGTVDAKDLNLLALAGVIVPDDKLEEFLRKSSGLPQPDMATARRPVQRPAAPVDPNAPANAETPPYDGANPDAPITDRINQPTKPSGATVTSLPVAASAYAQQLMQRIEMLAANAPA